MPMTAEQRLEKKRADEAARQARIRAAKDRLAKLPDERRAAVLNKAEDLRLVETETRKPRAAVAYLEEALAAVGTEAPKKKAAKTAPRKGKPAIKATVKIEVAGDTRTCPRCQEDKPSSDFRSYRSDCRECYNARWREWDAARKAKKAAQAS